MLNICYRSHSVCLRVCVCVCVCVYAYECTGVAGGLFYQSRVCLCMWINLSLYVHVCVCVCVCVCVNRHLFTLITLDSLCLPYCDDQHRLSKLLPSPIPRVGITGLNGY